jgi:uncharacterized NAD(P)/FAD-binding protein YdhS/predicted metal-dependent enzyme (double-stranded beta helix superfamily)
MISPQPQASPAVDPAPRLQALIRALSQRGTELSLEDAAALLRGSDVRWDDVQPYVVQQSRGYARRRVARGDAFELLVLTWRPGQGSAPHDHVGSACAFRVLHGAVTETHFELGSDGLVCSERVTQARANDVVVGRDAAIHALANADSSRLLVTLHVYAPPLPELRCYATRDINVTPLAMFNRKVAPKARTVAIIGGGFSGTIAAAQLVRQASARGLPLHVVLFDRHSSFGEGPAYRTTESTHLLNVPAARMSAWPDDPEAFLRWAKTRDPAVAPYTFLPRRTYGEYVRATLLDTARAAGTQISARIHQDEVVSVATRGDLGFHLTTRLGGALDADAVILATGHRPPGDPFAKRWYGSRARLIADPWASLALSSIRPDEPVVIMGTGLTAIDALLTLSRERRTAAVIAISRRGLVPTSHLTSPLVPSDAGPWLDPLLSARKPLSTLVLLRALREQLNHAEGEGRDWRTVIDGLRAYTPHLWRALPEREAARFLRHLRPFWEVRRHRMAPAVAATVHTLRDEGLFKVVAGRALRVDADQGGAQLQVQLRGTEIVETVCAGWIINCTGPSTDLYAGKASALSSLLEAGQLVPDAFGLGVRSGARGEARNAFGKLRPDLVIVGSLRKPQAWESTAVPELRVQAERAATAVLEHLSRAPRPAAG